MSIILAPGVSAVLSAGERLLEGDETAWSDMRSALDGATRFVDREESLFAALWHALALPEGASPDVVRERVRRAVIQQRHAIEVLERFLEEGEGFQLQQGLFGLEEATARLAQEFDDLREAGRERKAYSPFPSLHCLVAAGLRVHEGTSPADCLRDWLPAAAATIELLGGQVELFSRLHPSQEALALAARKLVSDLQQGIGALLLFEEKADRTALLDGLKLLRHASERLRVALDEMNQCTGREGHQGAIPGSVREFAGAFLAWRAGGIDRSLLLVAFTGLGRLAALYRGQVEALEEFPLFYVGSMQEVVASARERVERLERVLDEWRPMLEGAPNRALDLVSLQGEVLGAQVAVEAATRRLEEEATRLRGAPRVEELRELVGRVLLGTASEVTFRDHLQSMLLSTDGLKVQLRGLPSADSLEEATERLRRALEHMATWFESRDAAVLVDGVEAVAQAATDLLAAARIPEG